MHAAVPYPTLLSASPALAWRASVVAHGICIEIWSGRWPKTDEGSLRRLVDQLVEPIAVAYLRDVG